MSKLRGNITFAFVIPAILIIILAYGYMVSAKDNATFYLMDIDGERTALDGVNITGCLQDNYHGYYFEIEDGIVESRFKYYQEQKDIAGMEDIHYSNGLQHDGVVYTWQYEYEISEGAKTNSYETIGVRGLSLGIDTSVQ